MCVAGPWGGRRLGFRNEVASHNTFTRECCFSSSRRAGPWRTSLRRKKERWGVRSPSRALTDQPAAQKGATGERPRSSFRRGSPFSSFRRAGPWRTSLRRKKELWGIRSPSRALADQPAAQKGAKGARPRNSFRRSHPTPSPKPAAQEGARCSSFGVWQSSGTWALRALGFAFFNDTFPYFHL